MCNRWERTHSLVGYTQKARKNVLFFPPANELADQMSETHFFFFFPHHSITLVEIRHQPIWSRDDYFSKHYAQTWDCFSFQCQLKEFAQKIDRQKKNVLVRTKTNANRKEEKEGRSFQSLSFVSKTNRLWHRNMIICRSFRCRRHYRLKLILGVWLWKVYFLFNYSSVMSSLSVDYLSIFSNFSLRVSSGHSIVRSIER